MREDRKIIEKDSQSKGDREGKKEGIWSKYRTEAKKKEVSRRFPKA